MNGNSIVLSGTPVSPGIAIGEVFVYQPFKCKVQELYFDLEEAEEYIASFVKATNIAIEELDRLISMFEQEDDKAKILLSHKEILNDEEIQSEIKDVIRRENKFPDFAVKSVYEKYIELFEGIEDPTISARATDLIDVKNRLIRVIQKKKEKNLSMIQKEVIVVAHDLLPSETATLNSSHVIGIITELGSYNSHSAIIARNYKVPAVLGVPEALKYLTDGMNVVLDGIRGEIVVFPNENILKVYKEKAIRHDRIKKQNSKYQNKPAITRDGHKIEIGINIGSNNFNKSSSGYDFVGLFRTEFLYMESNQLPDEQKQFLIYKGILEDAKGKSVTLRTLDIGGDKTLPYMDLPKETNSFLGKRGVRFCIDNKEIFRIQLRAALRASYYGSLQLMFPMISSLDDIRKVKLLVDEVMEELRMESIPFDENIKLGIMVEVPSIAIISDLVAEEVDFASIGTNDLIQYVCATDRMNVEVKEYYQSLSPGMLRLLNYIFTQFGQKGKPISVCGEMAAEAKVAVLLVGLGARKLSMSEGNISEVKAALSGVSIKKAKEIAAKCMEARTEHEVIECLENSLGGLINDL